MKGSWRFILDKPGQVDPEIFVVSSFRTASAATRAGSLLLAERGQGWRLTVEYVEPQGDDAPGTTMINPYRGVMD